MHKIRKGTYYQTGFRYCDESFIVSACLYAARANSRPKAMIWLSLKDGEEQILVDTVENCTEEQLEELLTTEITRMEHSDEEGFTDSIFWYAAEDLLDDLYEDEGDDPLDLDELGVDEDFNPEFLLGKEVLDALRELLGKYSRSELNVQISLIPENSIADDSQDDETFLKNTQMPEGTGMTVRVDGEKLNISLNFPGLSELQVQQYYLRLKNGEVLGYQADAFEKDEHVIMLLRNPDTTKKQRSENGEVTIELTYRISSDTVAGSRIR